MYVTGSLYPLDTNRLIHSRAILKMFGHIAHQSILNSVSEFPPSIYWYGFQNVLERNINNTDTRRLEKLIHIKKLYIQTISKEYIKVTYFSIQNYFKGSFLKFTVGPWVP